MKIEEVEMLVRLKSYGNMSQAEAQEYHRLLNLEEMEKVQPEKPTVILPEPTPVPIVDDEVI